MIKLPNMILSTTSTLDGWTVKEYIGPVSAQVVAGTGLVSDIFASFSDVFGGRSESYKKQLGSINDEVTLQIAKEAQQFGANCIIGLRIDHDEISGKGKSMFMVTASGTAVRAEKVHGQTETILPTRTMSALELQIAVRKADLIRDAQAGELKWDQETRNFIRENQLAEFIPYIVRGLAFGFEPEAGIYDEQETELENFGQGLLAVVPREHVVEEVYNLLMQENKVHAAIFEAIRAVELLEFEPVLSMLNSQNPHIQRRALEVLNCEKPFYLEDDIDQLTSIVGLVESTFKPISQAVEKKSLFSQSKQMWICVCGHKNEMHFTRCDHCLRDIYGFRKGEIGPTQIASLLKKKVLALRAYFPAHSPTLTP